MCIEIDDRMVLVGGGNRAVAVVCLKDAVSSGIAALQVSSSRECARMVDAQWTPNLPLQVRGLFLRLRLVDSRYQRDSRR